MKFQTQSAAIVLAFFSLLAPSISASEAHCQSESVVLESAIDAVLSQPQVMAKSPMVLMLHGFASSKNEVGDLYKRLADSLCKQSIGSLRIDFRGWGESKGLAMTQSSVETMLADAETAYQYLNDLAWVDTDRLGIIGFSLGGGIAITSASLHHPRYKTMVTWSSVGDFHQDFLSSTGQASFDKAANGKLVELDLGWRKVTLGPDFFNSLSHYSLEQLISQYKGSYLAIAGSDDFSSQYTKDYVSRAHGSPKHALIIPGADHIFGVLSDDQTVAKQVILTTSAWFNNNL
jgi:pimeloyl-ACP methyl ester carboxylesterase